MYNSHSLAKNVSALPSGSLPACQLACSSDTFLLLDANRAFHSLFCSNNTDLSLPKFLHEVCAFPQAFAVLTKNLKQNRKLENFDVRFDDNRSLKHYRINVVQQQHTHDQTVWTLYFQDISDLMAEIENAQATSKTKALFLATMSHEIRTPMQPLHGLLEIMQQKATDAGQAEIIHAAKGATSALLQVLDDVLDLTKIEAGHLSLDYAEVPLRTLIDGVITTFSQKAKEKGIYLSAEFSSGVPPFVMGDPKRLRKIMMNLVGNALKFTKQGSVSIRLQCQDFEDDGQHFTLRCEVEDSGIGISAELLPHLFEPFTLGDSSASRRYRETGLGLSITQRLVQTMHGVMGVDSTEGHGSLFWFNIPTSVVAQEAVSVEIQPDLRGVHVLLVEDHPQGARTIMMALESMGATVVRVDTIEDALYVSEIERFDIAVIDYLMPDGSGLALIEKLATTQPHTGLLMYTVFNSPKMQDTLKKLGVLYVEKPASRLRLGQAVESLTYKIQRAPYRGLRKILIVEDTPTIQDILQRQFECLNYTNYAIVDNGAQALKVLQREEFGLVIADLHLPEMDGYKLIKTLRQQPHFADLPIIALTADEKSSNAQACLRYGFNECLRKPVTISRLRQMLLRWGILEGNPLFAKQVTPLPKTNILIIDDKQFLKRLEVLDSNTFGALELFIRLTPPLLQDMGEAITQSDIEKLRDLAHALKDSARAVCCPELSVLAETLQDSVDKEAGTLKRLVEDIGKAFETVEQEVKRLGGKAVG